MYFFYIVNKIPSQNIMLLISNFHGLKTRHETSQLHIQTLINLKTIENNRIDIYLSENLKKA